MKRGYVRVYFTPAELESLHALRAHLRDSSIANLVREGLLSIADESGFALAIARTHQVGRGRPRGYVVSAKTRRKLKDRWRERLARQRAEQRTKEAA